MPTQLSAIDIFADTSEVIVGHANGDWRRRPILDVYSTKTGQYLLSSRSPVRFTAFDKGDGIYVFIHRSDGHFAVTAYSRRE